MNRNINFQENFHQKEAKKIEISSCQKFYFNSSSSSKMLKKYEFSLNKKF
jgi:hypothetical protein